MADARRLAALGTAAPLARELAKQMGDEGGGAVSPDDIAVAAITADNFSFAGGTLTQALQALADAIPAE